MARVAQEYQQFNFSQGKITEATPLSFPENAALELDNMDLRKDGSVRRRLGLDYETNYNTGTTVSKTLLEDAGINSFLWKSVGGVGGRDFLVVQVEFTLYFFDATAGSFSANAVGSPLDLSSYTLGGALGTKEFGFSSGNGYLFVVGEEIEPIYVDYDDTGPTFTATQINIKIRDFDGVKDNLDIDERPTFLLNTHRYNLKNQGWPDSFSCYQLENGDSAPLITDPIQHTYNMVGYYPSNADIIHLSKSTASKFIEGIGSYSPWFLKKLNVGNTRAPRGRFILDAFVRNRVSASGVSGIPTVTYNSRPSATAFFAGRVFYAGMTDGDLVGTVYFSQLLTEVERAGNCYQEQDPTAEQLNSLLATDGGAIEIPDVGKIYKMIPFERSVVIVADNGVWEIVSSDTTGFTASSFFIRFVTKTGAIGPGTITEVEGGVCYWADSGIYLLSPDTTSGILSATNLTLNTIQSDYLSIPKSSRMYARSFYDAETNKLIFLYKEDQTLTQSNYQFDKILYLDITLSAFYTYTMSFDGSDAPIVCGIARKQGLGVVDQTFDIVLGADDVVLGADDIVHSQASGVTSTASAIKLITAGNVNTTTRAILFSEFYDRKFVDWETHYGSGNGLDFTSKMVTGYQIFGEAARNKQIQWYIPHFERTERVLTTTGTETVYDYPSGCTMQVRYDFTSTNTAGKWSGTFEGYRLKVPYMPAGGADPEDFNYSYEVISTKNRVRGAGRALQFSITSQAGKDIRLLGWDVVITGRSRV